MSLINEISKTLETADLSVAGAAMPRIVENIQDIVDGKVNPLELLMKDDLLTDLYKFAGQWDYTACFSALTHKKPNLKVLEIGAGTGITASIMLKHLYSRFGERMFASYTVTCISAGSLDIARGRFRDHVAIDQAILDISKDSISQRFQAHSYDLIIAVDVGYSIPYLFNVKIANADNRRFMRLRFYSSLSRTSTSYSTTVVKY